MKTRIKNRPFRPLTLVIGLVSAGFLISSCASGPRPLRLDEGLIAFVGEEGNIHVADIWGADKTLTDDAGEAEGRSRVYGFPSWSPADRKLAYVEILKNADGSTEASLHASGYAGGRGSPVFSSSAEVPFYLSWSPAGDRIGFLSTTAGGRSINFRISPLQGEGRLAGSGSPFYWAWSPDGRAVATHEGEPASGRGSRLRVLDAVGDKPGVDLQVRPGAFQTPAYSPDGRYFAGVGRGPGGEGALLVASRDGSDFRPVAAIRGAAVFDWSPVGGRIAYVDGLPTPVGVIGPLKVVDVERPVLTVRRTVSHSPEPNNVIAFFWSPEGRRIIYFEPVFGENSAGRTEVYMTLSVLEVDTNTTRELLSFQPTPSFLGQIVPYYNQYQKSSTIWSPDGKNVVINAVTQDGRPAVIAVNLAGEWEPWFVGYGTFPFWSRM
jgi:Tol biopolymer transport system component